MYLRLILFLAIIFPLAGTGQKLPLMIEGKAPAFYISHTVDVKENYYSIGRIYNVSPSMNMAPFNELKLADGLKIGQVIMIPLVESNFSQDGNKAEDEVLIPVYYKTTGKKALYQVGQQFNNVPSAMLKKWNRQVADPAPDGASLIIGYLKVKEGLSPLAASYAGGRTEKVKPAETVAAVAPVATAKETPDPVRPVEAGSGKTGSQSGGGYFRTQYEKQRGEKSGEKQSGTAGVFKSTSGWDDGKYYCLNNSAPAGSIIKVTRNDNNKSIYAKVLDAMPDMEQNKGLILRLGNSAAAELGVEEGSFECTIEF